MPWTWMNPLIASIPLPLPEAERGTTSRKLCLPALKRILDLKLFQIGGLESLLLDFLQVGVSVQRIREGDEGP